MFARHRLNPANKLDCPHAVGTDTFSRKRPESFRHLLLLPPPHSTPSLRSVAQGRLRLLTTDESRRIFESALERVRCSFGASGLRVRRHAGACSPPAQRATAGYVQQWNCPTQAKRRLEWATRPSPIPLSGPLPRIRSLPKSSDYVNGFPGQHTRC